MRPWLRCDSLFPQRYGPAGVACSGLADDPAGENEISNCWASAMMLRQLKSPVRLNQ